MNTKAEDWLFKCKQCKHCYQVKTDADEVRCRLKFCRYEPTKEVEDFHKLQAELKAIKESEGEE